jgi:NhaP-type Na+/H+ or K+/H+ antiporter
MPTEPLFTLSDFHVLLAVSGAAILLANLLPRLLFRRPTSSSALLMLMGFLTFGLFPGMPLALDPVSAPQFWETTSEFAVIVVLFATGLRIDALGTVRHWLPTVRLLLVAMPLTILAVALLGWGVAGFTAAGAVLLGAALAPTDPVLAGDVQVGPPLEGKEDPVRFTLTAEAGLNDGLAFPFVYLGLAIAAQGGDPSSWLAGWILWDVVYRIAVGAAGGAAIGWILGRALFTLPDRDLFAQGGPGVVALAAVFLTYGIVELAEGYGFIGAFVAGVVCRRAEARHDYHRQLHGFSEAIEHALTAVLLFLLGGALPALWVHLDADLAVVGLALLLVVRPVAGWLSLVGTELRGEERAFVSFFGVRGIGSVYYLSYAAGHIEFADEAQLWALVAFTVFASTVLHGGTSFVVERFGARDG